MFSDILKAWLNTCRDLETMRIGVIRREASQSSAGLAGSRMAFFMGLLEPTAPAGLSMGSAYFGCPL